MAFGGSYVGFNASLYEHLCILYFSVLSFVKQHIEDISIGTIHIHTFVTNISNFMTCILACINYTLYTIFVHYSLTNATDDIFDSYLYLILITYQRVCFGHEKLTVFSVI